MADIKNPWRCINPKCKKVLGDVEMKSGKITVKCKCGTVNTLEAVPPPEPGKYIHNTPYQNRMDLANKG